MEPRQRAFQERHRRDLLDCQQFPPPLRDPGDRRDDHQQPADGGERDSGPVGDRAGTAFSYAFPANTFSDADTSDTLTYTATKADDTALPTWLAFAASTRTFSGTPTDAGMVAVKVTASDGNGGSVSDTFDITVAADTTPPTLTSAEVDVGEGMGVSFEFSENLQGSNPPPASAFTVTVDGSAATVSSVGVPGSLVPQNQLFLTVSPVITQGQAVVVSYTDPTASDDASAIQDVAGNDAASFTTGSDGVPAVINASIVVPAATEVPADWSLKPTAVTAGTQFRLLFLSSTKRNATSTDIADYNTFIQGRAAAGHADIQTYSTGFRAVGCTAAVDARDNTYTTYTSTDKGVPIYWLNGAKAADEYEDFYDGSWDDEANDKNESGTNGPDTSQNNNRPVTGCSHDGTELTTFGSSRALGAAQVSVGRPNSSGSGRGPLFADALIESGFSRPMYGLSGVFQVAAAVVVPNNPPTVANAIPDQSATAGTAFSYAFPDTTFTDADTGDTLSYTATKADDTALPTWLAFAASTRTFSGTPQAADIATVAVKVTASDGNGGSVSDTFDITVAADTTPPTLTSAGVNEAGLFILLGFSENLQLSNLPPASAFTVTAGGSAVTVSGVLPRPGAPDVFVITVSPAIRQGQAIVVTYTDPTAGDDATAFQDIAGNDAATFTTGMDGVPAVTNSSTFTNTPATGAPTITGTAQVGQTLTAGTTAIMDADGLTSVSYTYQWIRTAAGVDTNISGAMASTYTLVAADQGTTIKVTVSFTDDLNNPETLTSAATAAVSAAPNTLPLASDGTVTTNEDSAHTFAAAEFNFSDADPGDTLESVEIITLPASGTGTLALSGTPVTAGQEIAEADIGTLTYTPPANANGTGYASFTFKVSDGTAESAAAYTMTITVTAVNDAPTVANTIPDRSATAGTAFSYAFPANTFSDADTGDTLTYAATKADGATLPTWLSFAAGTRTFSGTPQTADVGTVSVKVTASDGNGGSGSDDFDIMVSAASNTPATGAPTITGTAQVGQTLTAGTTAIMDAEGLTTPGYTYQWIRVATDNTETNIASATASTYTLVAADQGTTIKVTVSFTDDLNNPETLTSAATAAVSAAANTPATGAPTITGTAQVGQTLTAGTTAIVDADGLTSVSYTYQWIRTAAGVDTNISGATASTYTLVTADLGTTIKVTVSFTDDASNPETRTSAATAAVSAAPNTPATGAPTITGTAQVGQTLTAGTTAIVDADGLTSVSYAYQWIRVATDNSETNIASATASTYTPVTADLGTTIKVKVSFTDDASNAETLTSNVSVIIARPANTAATGKPGITGTAQVGQTLTATVGTSADVDGLPNPFLTDVNTSFQWIRVATDNTETNIASATASTYTLVDADLGTTIKVKVGFADNYDYDETLTSDATAAVAASTNTPPSASNGTVTTNEDTAYTFAAADFNFSDTDPGDTLESVEIITLPASGTGTLALSGTPVTAGQEIAEAGIGTLTYTPPANANGAGYASFTFGVSDGEIPSPAYTMTINVTAVNDAPTAGQTGKTMVWFGTEAYTATEGGADAQVSVHLSEAVIGEPLDVRLLLEYGGGAAAADHGSIPTVVTFGVGQRTKTITVAATDDVLDDDGESVSLGFSNDHRDRVITGHGSITATVALEDNDGNERVDVSFGAGAYKATEGGTDATVEVKLDAAPGRSVEIPLMVTHQGLASAADYSSIPASVTFEAEETSKTIGVTATVDVDGDGGESVRLEFGKLPASVFAGSPAAAVVTLFDSNTHLGVGFVVSFGTAQTVLVRESSTVRHRFGVYLGTRWQPGSGRPSKPVTIPLVVTRRGATEDDHTEIPASVTFGVNEGASGFSMRAIPDQTTEPDEELTITFGQPLPPGVRLPAAGRCCRTLEVELVDLDVGNVPATGAPTITGTPAAGETLTADVSGISDVDGLSGVTYTYQWIRVVNGSDIGIPGATLSTYTLQSEEDAGNKVKVRVSFTDGKGGDEMLTSDEYPSSGTINEEETSSVVVPDPPPFSPPTEEVVENPPTEEVEEGCAVSDVTGDDRSLEIFVECAAQRIEDSDTFTETLRILEGFRDDEGNWNDGSTYLVLLTARGGVYFHANDRDVEDLDWSGILSCEGEGSVLDTEEGCFIEYEEERRGYAHPLSASHVPLARDEAEFVLLGGFNKIPEEGKPFTGMIGEPSTEAGEVDTDDRLRKFVGEAGRVLREALEGSGIDPAELRGILRREGGPWREGDVYIYILGETGRVIFDGADRDREQKNESAKRYVRDLISGADADVVEYREDGFLIRGYTARVEVLDAVYFVGSGYRVEGQPGGSDSGGGGCAVGGSDKGGAFGLFLAALTLLLAVSLKRRPAPEPFWGNSR